MGRRKLVIIGKVEENGRVITVRLYDDKNKSIEDKKINNKIELMKLNNDVINLNKIDKVGNLKDNAKECPLVLIKSKDDEHKLVDINGKTVIKTIDKEDFNKYNIVDIKSNIKQYSKYIKKLKLIGEEIFDFCVYEETDSIVITGYRDTDEESKVIDIPSFVTDIHSGIFEGVRTDLTVTHRNNQIKDMSGLFCDYEGRQLILRNFDTTNVDSMENMFNSCIKVEELDLSSFNTSKVTSMFDMFTFCQNLDRVNLSSFDTTNVLDMACMFRQCNDLEELDISNFNFDNVRDINRMFEYCYLEKLKIPKNCDLQNLFDKTGLNEFVNIVR